MIRNLSLVILAVLSIASANAQLVITEIMYNPPEGGTDSTEYVEIHNAGSSSIDLMGYELNAGTGVSGGIQYSFTTSTIINDGEYVVVAADSSGFRNTFGFSANYSGSGSLSNSTKSIVLKNGLGTVMDSVKYDDGNPWPSGTDGQGASIELCDVSSDNTLGDSWIASTTATGIIVNGNEIHATPGAANSTCTPSVPAPLQTYLISEINGVDTDGIADSVGVECIVYGVVHCQDFDGNGGYSFTITESSTINLGINVFSFSDVDDYVVTEGDSIRIEGTIGQFNGLLNITPDSILVISQGNPLVTPILPTVLDESTESKVIALENLTLVDANQWTGSGSFNVDATDGTNTFTLRIDSDAPMASNPAPAGTFDVTGIGSQYDNTVPRTEGYQLILCTLTEDVVTPPAVLPTYLISEINAVDTDGVPDSNNVGCVLYGVVHCQDFDGNNGYSFLLTESSTINLGINVYKSSDVDDYVVTEGDSIRIEGTIGHFNGLLQIQPDSIQVISQGNPLVTPITPTVLDESTENKVITLENLTLVDANQWGTGSFNVDATDGTNTFNLRIDSDAPMASNPAPAGTFDVTGVGSQYDNSVPHTEGYQLLLCTLTEDVPTVASYPNYLISEIDGVNANGVADSLNVTCEINGIVLCQDFDGNEGYDFTISESSTVNVGIKVFSFDDLNAYSATEGDSLRLVGKVSQFNGHLQFRPDTIEVLSQGNTIVDPMLVTELSETTENKLLKVENLTLVDPAQWTGSGSGFNVDATNGTNTIKLRIDNDSPLYTEDAPADTFEVIGLGGQFDSSEPHTEGYQLFPCSLTITADTTNSIADANGIELNVYPNPVENVLNISTNFTGKMNITIVSIDGKIIENRNVFGSNKIDMNNYKSGYYFVKISSTEINEVVKVIKK